MLCTLAKKKPLRHYVDVVVKVFRENCKITLDGCRMPIKDAQKWGELRAKFGMLIVESPWVFADRRRRGGGENFKPFCGHFK